MSCGKLESLPDLRKLEKLRKLDISDCPNITVEMPDCRGMTSLQTLSISGCKLKDVSGLSNLNSLERLLIEQCKILETPDLQGLTRLKSLYIRDCVVLRRPTRRLDNISDDCAQAERFACRSAPINIPKQKILSSLIFSSSENTQPCGYSHTAL